jgi:hypothetical protein
MTYDDPILAAEREMLHHATEVTAEAIEVLHAMRMANLTGVPVWRWGTGDPYETIEAARAIRAFRPSSRPLDRPDDAA